MRDKEDLIKIRRIPFSEVFYGKGYGVIGKGGETGNGNIGRRKALRLGMCMGPGPKVKEPGRIGSVY